MSDVAAAVEPEPEDEHIEMDDLRADIGDAKKKIVKMAAGNHVEGKHLATFLRDELLPVFESLTEKIGQQEEAIFDLFEDRQMVSPENATIILSALQAGANLAAYVESVYADDAKVVELVATYRSIGPAAEKVVQELVAGIDENEEVAQ